MKPGFSVASRKVIPAAIVLLLVTLVTLAVSPSSNTALAHKIGPGTPPAATRSYYVQTIDAGFFYEVGREQGRRYANQGPHDAFLILLFGEPMFENGIPGAYIYGDVFVNVTQIRDATIEFARGWYYGTPAFYPTLHLALGVTNRGSDVNETHGRAWAQLINDVASVVHRSYGRQITVAGAIDAEVGWNSFGATFNWIEGYQALARFNYYDFGDAAGCYPAQPGWSNPSMCDNGWTRQQVWYKSWGARRALPIPQIYFTRNNDTPRIAGQWQKMSLYSVLSYGYKVGFQGTTTQRAACEERPGERTCYNTGRPGSGEFTNTPAEAWLQLMDKLNNNDPAYHGDDPNQAGCTEPPNCHRTTDTPRRWTTDMSWRFHR